MESPQRRERAEYQRKYRAEHAERIRQQDRTNYYAAKYGVDDDVRATFDVNAGDVAKIQRAFSAIIAKEPSIKGQLLDFLAAIPGKVTAGSEEVA
jgi:hypothetical protein